ncbi:ribokinase [Limosilactobacillus caccae]|uniref:ribokinase n=1 Tax=Limosilactobacillus caccae TaxID=1926284 RepID=UPI0009707F98|nr:ribokinase [Limosilactobacillus caccae]
MTYDITVIGSNMMELSTDVDRMPKLGETVAAPDFHMAFGGKGANQAFAASQLGAKVAMISKVGADVLGREYLKHFEESGIDVSGVSVGKKNNGVAPCFIQGEMNSIIIVQGANSELTPDTLEDYRDIIKNSKLIVLQQEISLATDYRAIEIAHEYGVPVMLNPAPANDQIDIDHVAMCEFYSPNETELGRLTKMPIETIEQIKAAANKLVDLGVKNVIVTIGSRGALWVSKDHEELIPSYKVKAVDSIGAGDSFVGAFSHYYTSGEDISTALRHANAYAAVTVTRSGSQTSYPSAAELPALQEKLGIAVTPHE